MTIRQQLTNANSERDQALGQVKLLEKQLAEKERHMMELYKQLAQLEAQRKEH